MSKSILSARAVLFLLPQFFHHLPSQLCFGSSWGHPLWGTWWFSSKRWNSEQLMIAGHAIQPWWKHRLHCIWLWMKIYCMRSFTPSNQQSMTNTKLSNFVQPIFSLETQPQLVKRCLWSALSCQLQWRNILKDGIAKTLTLSILYLFASSWTSGHGLPLWSTMKSWWLSNA